MTLLTPEQVAERLQLSRSTVYRWATLGRLPYVRLAPTVVRFDPAAIDEWIQARQVAVA